VGSPVADAEPTLQGEERALDGSTPGDEESAAPPELSTEAAEPWDPGLPPLRAIAPSAIGGAVVPLAVFYLVRSHVGSDATALAIAGIPAALWVGTNFVRKRTIDPIGVIVLAGFVVGLTASYALGGNAFVLKVRESAFTLFFGLGSLVTARFGRRPLTFYLGRALSAGSDRHRLRLYDELWEVPPARATFRVINLVWGFGLVFDAGARVLLAANLSTKTFLAVSPLLGLVFIGGMSVFTFWLTHRSRHRAPLVDAVDIPNGGGSTWWWLRVYLRPAGLAHQAPPGR